MELPEQFTARMKERLGKDFPAFLRSYETPPCKGLRVNVLKILREEFVRRSPFPLEDAIEWEKDAFYLSQEKPGGDVYHFAGLFYMQEPSAMFPVSLLGAEEGERILDLCAAPGGKTTQIASRMRGKGILIANEVVPERAKILLQNTERMGIKNCAVTCAQAGELSERFPEYFDRILVDAPCSGEGMFKKEKNALIEWSEKNVLRCAVRQGELLGEAAKMLRPGGTMVYSTCTFSEEENEKTVEKFLLAHREFSLRTQKTLYPHEIRGEGQFCACLVKEGEAQKRAGGDFPHSRREEARRAFSAFSEDFFCQPLPGEIAALADGRMFLIPENAPDFKGVRLLRLGVELGTFDSVFKPAHALAMAFGSSANRKIRLSRTEAENYLRGEALSSELSNGWCAVCVEEFPLGLGKAVNGTVKNHLPKGLRMIR